ncbi:MAG: hypothetical protein Q9169_008624 [Polycauliona sp. 2 TL-2023]
MSTTTIAENGDLLVEVVEWDYDVKWTDNEPIIRGTQSFWVSRQVLQDHSRMLAGRWKEANKTNVKVEDDSIPAMEIWLQVLHNVEPNFAVSIHAMWYIAKAAEKYGFDPSLMTDWFAQWYEKQPLSRWDLSYQADEPRQYPDPRCLLYPCWFFDHYDGFRRITEFVAYHYTGHIMEVNPTRHRDLHLPQRVIQQLNAAKGRLRTIVHRDLYDPNDKLLRARCRCKAESLWGYEKALTVCEVWPLEKVAQKESMDTILDRLAMFDYEAVSNACRGCRQDYRKSVGKARSHTHGYFTGLCLGCMDRSKTLTGDEDADYWKMGSLKEDHVINCPRGGSHPQPMWWFSYMGQRQNKDTFERLVKKRTLANGGTNGVSNGGVNGAAEGDDDAAGVADDAGNDAV